LKWIVKVEQLNCLLKKSNVNVETMSPKEYDKQPLKTLMRTTRFGYVPNGRNKKFRNCKCKYVNSHWIMGIS
jgi:hypothetical protein